MAGFECCRHCVAPKRHPGCHATCPDYPIAKEEHRKLTDYLKQTDADKVLIAGAEKYNNEAAIARKKYLQGSKNRL